MPTLVNPHAYGLFSSLLGRVVDAGEEVEVTVEQAARVAASGVWKVIDDGVKETEAEVKTDVEPVEAEVKEDVDSLKAAVAPAKKAAAKRGSKTAEVSAAPVMETR